MTIARALSAGNSLDYAVASLFANSEVGAWYDPTDMSTLFQDSAGTTPVTALEQSVGRMLDKSGRGNHALQETSGNRPVLSARYNFAAKTEDVSDATWIKEYCTASSASKVIEDSTTHARRAYQLVSYMTSTQYVWRVELKDDAAHPVGWVAALIFDGSNVFYANIDLTNGAIGKYGKDGGDGVVGTPTIESLADGWYLVTGTVTTTSTSQYPGYANFCIYSLRGVGNADYGSYSYAGDGQSAYNVRKVDIRIPQGAATYPLYQTVNTATDYATAGFPSFLKFDGTNSYMRVTTLALPLVERMTMGAFAENKKVANQGFIALNPATGNDYNSNDGYLFGPLDHSTVRFGAIGSTGYQSNWTTTPTIAIPPAVFTEDKTAGAGYLRVNGSQVGSDTSFTEFNATCTGGLLLGARWSGGAVSATQRLNGRIYGVIVRGARSTAPQIAQAERWCARRAGITSLG